MTTTRRNTKKNCLKNENQVLLADSLFSLCKRSYTTKHVNAMVIHFHCIVVCLNDQDLRFRLRYRKGFSVVSSVGLSVTGDSPGGFGSFNVRDSATIHD